MPQWAGEPAGAGVSVESKGSRVDPHVATVVVVVVDRADPVVADECAVDATTAEDECARPPDAEGLLVHAAASRPPKGSAKTATARRARRRRLLVWVRPVDCSCSRSVIPHPPSASGS